MWRQQRITVSRQSVLIKICILSFNISHFSSSSSMSTQLMYIQSSEQKTKKVFLIIFFFVLSISLAAYLYRKRCYSFWSDPDVSFIEPRFSFGKLRSTVENEHFALQRAKFYAKAKHNKSPIIEWYSFLHPTALITGFKFEVWDDLIMLLKNFRFPTCDRTTRNAIFNASWLCLV